MRIQSVFFASLWFLSSFCAAAALDHSQAPAEAAVPAYVRALVSARLGMTSPEYHVHQTAGGFASTNPQQRLTANFDSRGVQVSDGAARWGMSLRSYGYGESHQRLPHAVAHVNGDRIDFARGPLTEWYVNGPAGLEQGFIVSKAPGDSRGQPLTVELTLSGNTRTEATADGRALQISDRSQHRHWRYAGLRAEDASGSELPSRLELRGSSLLIHVDDRGASYPVTIDPIVQVAELTRAGGAANDEWGYSVAITGNTIVVGWPNANVGGNLAQGAVYVFSKPAGGWQNMTQTAQLTAADGAANDGLGASIALTGNTIVAGSPEAMIKQNEEQGAAYVFVKPAGGWANMTQNAKLTASDGETDSVLGYSVAAAGNTIVLGAPFQTGALYVYTKPSGGWAGNLTQTAELTASGSDAYGLGSSLSVSGTTIAAGAAASTVNSNFEQGAVYVYTQPPSGWVNATQDGELTASDGNGFDQLGYAVAVTGGTVIAGAPYAEVNGNFEQGAAYVFVEPAGGWSNLNETAKLTASDGGLSDSFGSSLAVFAGDALLCGAPGATVDSNASQGAVYIFLRPANGWHSTSNFFAKETVDPGTAGAEFGSGVALNAMTGVASAPGATVGSNVFQGAVYVYQAH